MTKIVRIEKRHPEAALENLNRVTGLEFERWPESLLDCVEQDGVERGNTPSDESPGEAAERMARVGQLGS
ncbi:hypothetical protein [Alloalcanivorax mobilis]|uniref:hypothetical protein n=1 Tax=Alloalcanivorax mobilis TaxID=2019569 RepID=UPI000B5B122A|nr:hypothetical protein [Alloalcanivorax mobilis]ASK35092.1 hypothetical protein CEK62_12230 [Alcanivorax sp. N3-2A]|tara:strand:+ start:5436 stop:5645 length:210 start_codon:yes stop_codon:yes gene_type:complete